MTPLAFWVMETACAEAMKWPVPFRIAINLSPKLFWDQTCPTAWQRSWPAPDCRRIGWCWKLQRAC